MLKNKKRVIYCTLMIIWMVMVFYFSSQDGKHSQSTSDVFTEKIVKIFSVSDSSVAGSIRNIVSFIIRKSAHFTIFMAGGFVIYGFLNTFDLSEKNIIYYSILLGCLYAISDEIHQYFIPGRSAEIRDVFIDTFGVFFMVIIRWIHFCRKNDVKTK